MDSGKAPWSTDLEKLVKEFPAFYGTRSFISVFEISRNLSASKGRSIQFSHSSPTSRTFILTLSIHPRLGLLSSLFPSSLPTKTLYAPLPSTAIPLDSCYLAHLRPKYLPRHPNHTFSTQNQSTITASKMAKRSVVLYVLVCNTANFPFVSLLNILSHKNDISCSPRDTAYFRHRHRTGCEYKRPCTATNNDLL